MGWVLLNLNAALEKSAPRKMKRQFSQWLSLLNRQISSVAQNDFRRSAGHARYSSTRRFIQ